MTAPTTVARPGSSGPTEQAGRSAAVDGVVSYGFYLWHVPMLRWLRPLLVSARR